MPSYIHYNRVGDKILVLAHDCPIGSYHELRKFLFKSEAFSVYHRPQFPLQLRLPNPLLQLTVAF